MLFYSSILNSKIIIEKKRLENQDNWIIIFESSIFQLTFSEHNNNSSLIIVVNPKSKLFPAEERVGEKSDFWKLKPSTSTRFKFQLFPFPRHR